MESYLKQHEKSILEDFFTFLRFPSVSSEPEHSSDVRECAAWLADYTHDIGFSVETWSSESGHPILFAQNNEAGPSQPTLLIYNHYDVQPVDPLEEWVSPPFVPAVRDGEVYARGAQDNKGQCFYTLQALKAWHAVYGHFPINIKLIIEGEEECGSEHLAAVLPQKASVLQADYLAVIDMGIPAIDAPALTLGVRGLATMEITLQGSKGDLHSGSHGGIVFNPIHALVEKLASLRDAHGKILVAGFYDDVKAVDTSSLALDFDPEGYAAMFETAPSGGEQEFSPYERAWLRPTIEINGIYGGYAGSGFKTVIPAKAGAKISCRLVPDQDPQKIAQLVKAYFEARLPAGVTASVVVHAGSGRAVRSNPSSKVVRAFADAYQSVFDKKCKYIFSGGSIPIIQQLADACGGDLLLLGLGLPDDNIHAPNEHFGLDRLKKGAIIVAKALENLKRR